MAAITTTMLTNTPQLRPLNILNDLLTVANLVEACFTDSLDAEGHRYIQQMRRAGKDSHFLRWATTAMDTVSMPLSGYVWEENGEVVGNVSLIPFQQARKKVYLIANVAVRSDYRRQGIARTLTATAMQHARQRGAAAIWLHTRDDNPAAALYTSLGFRERARRTTWLATPTRNISLNGSGIKVMVGEFPTITARQARDWPQQEAWLQRLYPEELAWYQPISWLSFRPGLGPSLYRFFLDFETRQWAAWSNGQLLGVLAWQPTSGHADRLWAATSPEDGAPALTALLCHARRALTWRPNLALDFPANQVDEAIRSAGFQPRRTLIWMQADATDALDNGRAVTYHYRI